MLIPQFTIRWLMIVTAACAVVFSVLGLAYQGYPWAIGVSVAVATGAVMMLVYAAVFGLIWLVGGMVSSPRQRGIGRGASPFQPGVAPLSLIEGSEPVRDEDIPAAPILLEEDFEVDPNNRRAQ